VPLNEKVSDKEAKAIFREKWPEVSGNDVRSVTWPTPPGFGAWLRAQPVREDSKPTAPRLSIPGSTAFKTARTQPDGLWMLLEPCAQFVDLLVIEVCGTSQNLNDKRFRYAPSTTAMLLHVSPDWLDDTVTTRGGGKKQRRVLAEMRDGVADAGADIEVPVRWLQVLYAVPNDLYKKRTAAEVPGAHEYFCRHSSLTTYNSRPLQQLLSRMTIRSHFLTDPGR